MKTWKGKHGIENRLGGDSLESVRVDCPNGDCVNNRFMHERLRENPVAAISDRTNHFWAIASIRVCQGYGVRIANAESSPN